MSDQSYPKGGAAIRRRLLGDKQFEADQSGVYSDPTMAAFIGVANELIFDKLWARPGLDMKTRALICVVSDVATGRTAILPTHMRMAMGQGWTEQELTEVMLQLIGYVGAPVVRDAMMCASAVFAQARVKTD